MSDDWGWDDPSGSGGSSNATSGWDTSSGVCASCGENETWCQCDSSTSGPGAPLVQPQPPVKWLWGAVAAAIVGLLVGAVFRSNIWLAMTGWLLAGPAAVLIYGRFVSATTKVSAMAGYGRPSWLPNLMRAVPLVILIAVAVCAYSIADYIARHW